MALRFGCVDSAAIPGWLQDLMLQHHIPFDGMEKIWAWWWQLEQALKDYKGEIAQKWFDQIAGQDTDLNFATVLVQARSGLCFKRKERASWVFPAYQSGREELAIPTLPAPLSRWDRLQPPLPLLLYYQLGVDASTVFAKLVCAWHSRRQPHEVCLSNTSALIRCRHTVAHLRTTNIGGSSIANGLEIRFYTQNHAYTEEFLTLLAGLVPLLAASQEQPKQGRERFYWCPRCLLEKKDTLALEANLREFGCWAVASCDRCGCKIELWDQFEQEFAPDTFRTLVGNVSHSPNINPLRQGELLEGKVAWLMRQACQKFEVLGHDEGEDAMIEWTDQDGYGDCLHIFLQLKCGKSYFTQIRNNTLAFTVGKFPFDISKKPKQKKRKQKSQRYAESDLDVWLVLGLPNEKNNEFEKVLWGNMTEMLKKVKLLDKGVRFGWELEPMDAASIRHVRSQYILNREGHLANSTKISAGPV